MRTILGFSACVLLHLSLLNGVFGQTNHIIKGDLRDSIIYNVTLDIPAASKPWYKRMLSIFDRSPPPVLNVTYTFPPKQANLSDYVITGFELRDVDRYGKGCLARVVHGGLNYSTVTINLISKPGEGIHSLITIRGSRQLRNASPSLSSGPLSILHSIWPSKPINNFQPPPSNNNFPPPPPNYNVQPPPQNYNVQPPPSNNNFQPLPAHSNAQPTYSYNNSHPTHLYNNSQPIHLYNGSQPIQSQIGWVVPNTTFHNSSGWYNSSSVHSPNHAAKSPPWWQIW